MSFVNQVKQFVKEECSKPSSKYGLEPYEYHFKPVVNYAKTLAREIGGDEEVILISAWLHDIGSIIHGRKDHHITGAKIAEDKLRELGYKEEKIQLVKKCILHHRGSEKCEQVTIEEKIVSDADALSNFENIPGIFKAAYIYENLEQGEAKTKVREKLTRKYNKLNFEKSKEIIKPKYEAVLLLLS